MKNLKIMARAQGMAQVLPLEKEVSFMCDLYVAFPKNFSFVLSAVAKRPEIPLPPQVWEGPGSNT